MKISICNMSDDRILSLTHIDGESYHRVNLEPRRVALIELDRSQGCVMEQVTNKEISDGIVLSDAITVVDGGI